MSERRPGRGRGERVRAVTRERLLATAEDLFFTQGFTATTVDAIAHEAGYTTGAVYSNFGGKADVFLAVLESAAAADLAAARAALDSAGSDGQRLDVFSAAIADDPQRWNDRVAATMEFLGYARHYPELRERIVFAQRAADEAVAALLAEVARSLGVNLGAAPEQVTLDVMAMLNGLSVRALFDDNLDLAGATARAVNRLLTTQSTIDPGLSAPAPAPRRKVGSRAHG